MSNTNNQHKELDMEWFSNAFFIIGAFVGSLALGFGLIQWRFRGYDLVPRPASQLNRWRIAAFSAVEAMVIIAATAGLVYALVGDYRGTPQWYVWFWGVLFIGTHLWLAVVMWLPEWARWTSEQMLNSVSSGGFWGNHFSRPNNPDFPRTTHNGWGFGALILFAIVLFSYFCQGGAWYFEPADVTAKVGAAWSDAKTKVVEASDAFGFTPIVKGTVDDGKKLIDQGKEEFGATPFGRVLRWVRPDSPPPAAATEPEETLAPLFPRSTTWFWLTLLTGCWALIANIACRRDGAANFLRTAGAAVQSLFGKKKPKPTHTVGTTETGKPPAPEAPVKAAAEAGPVKESAREAKRGASPSFAERVAEEAAAEVVIEAGEHVIKRGLDALAGLIARRGKKTIIKRS